MSSTLSSQGVGVAGAPAPTLTLGGTGAGRIVSLDIMRGLVMVIMALDHTRDFFTNLPFEPENLAQDLLRPIFHPLDNSFLCAVIFLSGRNRGLLLRQAKNATGADPLFVDSWAVADCHRIHCGRNCLDVHVSVGIFWRDLGFGRVHGFDGRHCADATALGRGFLRSLDSRPRFAGSGSAEAVRLMGVAVDDFACRGRRFAAVWAAKVCAVSACPLGWGDGGGLCFWLHLLDGETIGGKNSLRKSVSG